MGNIFSSNQLAGAVAAGNVPATSYAYSAGNTALFGVDATYSDQFGSTSYGYVTPYLVRASSGAIAATTVRCESFLYSSPSQSLKCPVTGAALASGLNTISFSAYSSTATTGTDGKLTTFRVSDSPNYSNTLRSIGGDVTFSIVPAYVTVTPTVTVTSTPGPTTTTVTSGISEVAATATVTVPKSTTTVTVYQSTVVSVQTSLSTLTGPSYVTVTGSCTSTSTSSTNTCAATKPTNTLLVCNRDNCLRALVAKSATASAFCSSYTKTCGLPTPTYASQCSGLASRVSSACSCLVTPTAAGKRGAIQLRYAPPDFTYSRTQTVTVAGNPSTVTSGPVPSSTVTDPNSTVSVGTSTSTDNEPFTLTVTVTQSTVDGRVASTITVAPTSCP